MTVEAPVSHLREYSNYLTPRRGIMSLDTATLVATYLRNLVLNWLVLIPMILSEIDPLQNSTVTIQWALSPSGTTTATGTITGPGP